MKPFLSKTKLFLITLIAIIPAIIQAESISPSPNGIKYPAGLNNWRVISTSYRNDNNTQRAILGNSIAINAARSGQTNPWPEGSILAKLVWKNTQHPVWEAAIVPGEFVHSEIMIKDSTKFNATKGWGYARWKGENQQPYGENDSFAQECFSCHMQTKDNDYVFTVPAKIP
jgi:hypothetical protein